MPKQTTKPPVSEKSTKAELLDAYTLLLSSVEGKEEIHEQAGEEQKLVDQASRETVEKIVNDLSQVRLSANQSISGLTEKLTQEAERLATLKKAIAIAQRELEDTQKVKLKAQQLFSLIELEKKQEEQFNQEMLEKKQAWDSEQKVYEEQVKTERTRDEEEYAYNKKMQRTRDTQDWEEEKRKHAQQKAEEQKAREAMVNELEDLRKKVTTFPLEIEKEVKMRVLEAVSKTQREAQIQQTLDKQEADSQQKLAEQRIDSLEKLIASQVTEIKELKQQLEKATNHIKDIAVSVVEGRKETPAQIRSSTSEGVK